jgi:hypothetical protein
MQSMQIVSGFSDLKRQFRIKTSGVAAGSVDLRAWRIFVEDPSLGMNLMRFVTEGRDSAKALKFILELYPSHGFLL